MGTDCLNRQITRMNQRALLDCGPGRPEVPRTIDVGPRFLTDLLPKRALVLLLKSIEGDLPTQ